MRWWRKTADESHQAGSSPLTGRPLLLGLMLAILPAAHSLTHATVDGACGPGGWSASPSGKCYRLAPSPETVEVGKLSTYFECSETCGPGASLACLDSRVDIEFLSTALLGAWKERLPSTWRGIPLSAYVFVHGVNHSAQCSSRRASSSSPLRTRDVDSRSQYIHLLRENIIINRTWLDPPKPEVGTWLRADGRVQLVRDSARLAHRYFRRSFCICEQGMIEEPKFRAISDHYHWSRLRYATAMFFLPAVFAALAPIVVVGLCCVCVPHMRRGHRSTDAPDLVAHQAYLGQVHSWMRSAGVSRTRFLVVLLSAGWTLVVLAVNPSRMIGSGGVTWSPAFWERFGYCEYYWALLPWGVLLLMLTLRPIDAVAIRFISVLVFVTTLGSGALLVAKSVEMWHSQVIESNHPFRCSAGGNSWVSTHWVSTVALSVCSILVCVCPLLLLRACFVAFLECLFPTVSDQQRTGQQEEQAHWLGTLGVQHGANRASAIHSTQTQTDAQEYDQPTARSRAKRHRADRAQDDVSLTPRAQLRRLWLTVRLMLLAVFSSLFGGLLDTACKEGRLKLFWQQPPVVNPAFIWNWHNMTYEEQRVAFPGRGISLEPFPQWLFMLSSQTWQPNVQYQLATSPSSAQLLACCSLLLALLVSGATNRGRVLRALNCLLDRRDGVQRAVWFAAFMSDSDGTAVFNRACDSFRTLAVSALTLEVFSASETCNTNVRCVELLQGDAFISHSHADDAEAKWLAVQAWARSRGGSSRTEGGGVSVPADELLVWLDTASLDQAKLEVDLQCLPVYIYGCKEMLALVGPRFCTRLWVR